MKKVFYKIHDLTVSLDWSQCRLPWKFHKLKYFEVPESDIDTVDLEIEIGPFSIDTKKWLNVDHKFYAKPGELSFRSHWKGFKWKSHWSGLDGGPIKAKLQLSPYGILTFPWLLQAEWVMFWFIYKPLSELIWARRDRYVIHCSAASKNGKAVLFTGYGSGLKTSYAMHLVRKGWDFLGDDQILLTKDGISCLPVSLETFDFRVHEIDTEYITPLRLARLAIHQLKARKPRIKVVDHAEINAVNVVVRSSLKNASSVGISKDDAVKQTYYNCINETIAHLHTTPGTSIPLTAYKIMFPEFDLDSMWHGLEKMLNMHYENIPINRIEMTKVWDNSFMELAELGNV